MRSTTYPQGVALVAVGFATTVAMWLVAGVCRLPVILLPSSWVMVLLLACLAAGGAAAGRLHPRGWVAGILVGVVAALINMVVLGGLLTGPMPHGVSLHPGFWISGFVAASAIMGGLGGILGAQSGRFAPLRPDLWPLVLIYTAVVAQLCLFLLPRALVAEAIIVEDFSVGALGDAFLFPLSRMTGGILYEHYHRVLGALVGLATFSVAIVLGKTDQPNSVRTLAWGAVVLQVLLGMLGGIRVTGSSFRAEDMQPEHVFLFVNRFLALTLLATLLGLMRLYRETSISRIRGVMSQGYGGVFMGAEHSETTRYLAATAVRRGEFRREVLKRATSRHFADAPEVGLDMTAIAKLCVFFERRDTSYQICLALLLGAFFLALPLAIASAGLSIAVLVIVPVLAWGVLLMRNLVEDNWLASHFTREKFDPEKVAQRFPASLPHSHKAMKSYPHIIVYRGFDPFVGSGLDLGGWSFSLDVGKPSETMGLKGHVGEVHLHELHAAIESGVRGLGIHELEIQDVLIVNGRDIRHESWILSDPFAQPLVHTSWDEICKFVNLENPCLRHYKWIRIYGWGGDLVTSCFLRLHKQGQMLFVEANLRLLTPLSDTYRSVDRVTPHMSSTLAVAALVAFLQTPGSLAISWFEIARKLIRAKDGNWNGSDRALRRKIARDPRFNYGAASSLREQASSLEYTNFFQQLDDDMYVKTITNKVLDAVAEFLDDRSIDTTELRERRTTIINQGVILQRGDVRADVMAVGAQARSTFISPKNSSVRHSGKRGGV